MRRIYDNGAGNRKREALVRALPTSHSRPPERRCMVRRGPLSAGAVAVLAPRPAAGPALAFLQLLLAPPNTPLARSLLLGILYPADEFVAG
jgi:hypothetical protein